MIVFAHRVSAANLGLTALEPPAPAMPLFFVVCWLLDRMRLPAVPLSFIHCDMCNAHVGSARPWPACLSVAAEQGEHCK